VFKLLVHIGLPKTATTTLQVNVFKRLHEQGDINFLGRSSTLAEDSYFNPAEGIISQLSKKKNNAEIEALRCHLFSIMRPGLLNVLSEEAISLTHKEDHVVRFENLATVFSGCDLTILLAVRNPMDFLFSYYVEMHRWHYRLIEDSNDFSKFANRIINDPEKNEFDILFMERFLSCLKSNFESVEIILFEDLKNDPDSYFTKLSELLCVDAEDLSNMFLEKPLNTRVFHNRGKYSEAVTLDQKISDATGALPGNMVLNYLKQIKLLKFIYKWILLNTAKVGVLKPVEHFELVGEKNMELEKLLLLKADDLKMFDERKLRAYKYLK